MSSLLSRIEETERELTRIPEESMDRSERVAAMKASEDSRDLRRLIRAARAALPHLTDVTVRNNLLTAIGGVAGGQ